MLTHTFDVRRTLLKLAAWLFLGNFNGAIAHSSEPTRSCSYQEGKGRQTACAQKNWEAFQWLRSYLNDNPPTGYRLRRVVLDAGHGGKDSGCKGALSLEKHNALAIALKLGALIEAEYPDVQVIYTRKTDVFVELQERAAIANRNNADLFISIHCNAVSAPHIKGVETYVMGLHTAESNLEVAKRENAVILLEENYQRNYGDYNPNSPEAHIFSSVWQSAYLEQSILLAEYVQKYSRSIAKREDRSVRQAGFIVLHRTAMPAVLVEVGYLTNRDEERFLASEEGQNQMADAIFEAFRAYKARMEGMPLAARKNTAEPTQVLRSANGLAATATTSAPPPTTTASPTASTPPASTPTTAAPSAAVTSTSKLVSLETAPTARRVDYYADEFLELPPSAKDPRGQYRILLLSWNAKLDRNVGQFALLTDVEEEYANGQYHYYLGRFVQRTEAEKLLPDLYNLGFRTARIVSK